MDLDIYQHKILEYMKLKRIKLGLVQEQEASISCELLALIEQ